MSSPGTNIAVALIVAASENNVIGRDGAMPWHMPSDLKTFRRLTLGKPVVMGRKTFASIGRPLDGRDNIVVTRGDAVVAAPEQRLFVTHSVDHGLVLARRLAVAAGVDEVMVIGGAEIYRQALAQADRVYFTRIHATLTGNATFPMLDDTIWTEVSQTPIVKSLKDDFTATLTIFERRERRFIPAT